MDATEPRAGMFDGMRTPRTSTLPVDELVDVLFSYRKGDRVLGHPGKQTLSGVEMLASDPIGNEALVDLPLE